MKAKLTGCALLALSLALGASPKDPVQDLLARLDQAAGSFQSMTAKVGYLTHTAVIDDNTEESGTLIMKKARANEMQARIDFLVPDKRTVTFQSRKAQIYYPKIKTVQIYDLGSHGDQIDRFLMLGFGTSGTELARDYDVKSVVPETIQGQRTLRVELAPKTPEVQKLVSKLEMWITDPPAAPYPIREKIYEKGGDYKVVTYTDLKINPAVSADALKLKLPAGVKVEHPQQ